MFTVQKDNIYAAVSKTYQEAKKKTFAQSRVWNVVSEIVSMVFQFWLKTNVLLYLRTKLIEMIYEMKNMSTFFLSKLINLKMLSINIETSHCFWISVNLNSNVK